MKQSLLIFTICILIASTGCRAASTPPPVVAHAVAPKTSTPHPPLPTRTQAPSATTAPTSTPTSSPEAVLADLSARLPGCIPAGAQIQTGQVTGVVDGSTIAVQIDGQAFQIHYIGVNVPTAYSADATAANRKLVEGKTVTLVKDATDTQANGRLPRYVFVGSLFINDELVRKGMASAISDPPDTTCYKNLLQAEQEANAKRVGVWANSGSTQTPWGYGLEKLPAYTPTTIFTPTITPTRTPTRTATP